jgi:tRNA pseudouridine65 synthase
MTTNKLEIVYQDENYIAVHKPPGIHVHPTYLSRGEESCMKILRDRIGQWVYPLHRLDRAASGILLFGLSSGAAGKMIRQFGERKVKKRYLAVVRGCLQEKEVVDYPLREEPHKEPAEALTEYRRLVTVELPYPLGKFPTARYSLAEVFPHTGRKNQIRKHFAHISHPIIGDVRYGDGKHNRLFREKFAVHRLLLLAVSLSFQHPYTGELLTLRTGIPEEVKDLFRKLNWKDVIW